MVKGHSFSLQKDAMTMEELLAQLIKKTSVQCADDHRQIVASLNGWLMHGHIVITNTTVCVCNMSNWFRHILY